ncbi:hypothetical protein ES708_28749 [subsurface metagenome]
MPFFYNRVSVTSLLVTRYLVLFCLFPGADYGSVYIIDDTGDDYGSDGYDGYDGFARH